MVSRIIAAFWLACVIAACDAPVSPLAGQSSRAQISFIESPELQQHARVVLSAKSRSAFEEFQVERKAHGAFYVTQDGRSWGWHRNTATAADAQKTAKVACETYANRPCVLFATLGPGATDAVDALPAQYNDKLSKALRENRLGNDFALAVSPIGSYGWAWNYGFDSEAKAKAIQGCEENVESRRASFDQREREAFERNGIFECRIHLFF